MLIQAETAGPPDCWTNEYWLSRCEGYRVYTPDGPIGYVEEVVDPSDGEPSALVVRVGEEFTHRLTIPATAIEGFDPAGERVLVGPLETSEAEDDDPVVLRQLRLPAPL